MGYLESEVDFCGHTFVLRTLKADEELEAALIAKEYQESFGQVKAHAWAHLAAAVAVVDGDDDYCPAIGPGKRDHLRAKFRWMTERWYWPTAEFLFGTYADLIRRQADAIEAVESLSSRSLDTSWPRPDSLSGQADSREGSTDSNLDSSLTSPEQMQSLVDEDE